MKIKNLLVLVIGISIITLSGCSPKPTDEAYFEFDKEKGGITGYSNNAPKDIVIPKEIEGIRVKRIENGAFKSLNLDSVVIPDSVIMIGFESFQGNNLTDIKLPDSIITIGDHVFSYNKLEEIKFSENLTLIGSYAFRSNKLRSLDIPEGVEIINSSTFAENELEEVRIPKSIKIIETNSFTDNIIKNVYIDGMALVSDTLESEDGELYDYQDHKEIAEEKNLVFIARAAFDLDSSDSFEDYYDHMKVKSSLDKLGINQYVE